MSVKEGEGRVSVEGKERVRVVAECVKVEEGIGREKEGWGGCSSLYHEYEVIPSITNSISKQISLRI